MADEDDLVARAVAGDAAAFDALVRRHQSAVRGFLRRLTARDHALADDLAQETFWHAFARKHQFVAGSFLSWLYAIAWSRFLMDKRARKRAQARESLEQHQQHCAERGAQAKLDLDWALSRLMPAESAAITLCLGLGHTHEEAAAILQLPLGTLKSHIARGREKVKTMLQENGHGA
jgi:RNA polymerase sigma-70 factor (ECF subfamily)